MAITKEIVLNKLDINLQNPSIEVVKRVSFYEDGEEINRTHNEVVYSFKNEEVLFECVYTTNCLPCNINAQVVNVL